MDVTLFYKELFEDTLGLDVLGLEHEFPQLVRLVETKTLTTLGNYLPVRYLMYLDLSDQRNIIRREQYYYGVEYYLSDPVLEKFKLPILGIESINYNNVGEVDPYDPAAAAYHSSILASRQNLTFEGVMMGSEYTYNRTLTDFAMPFKRYHELRGSNVLYLKNWSMEGQVEITIKTRYPNLVCIPEEYREIVMTLAKFDVKIKLWNELKYLEDVVTPAGNLNLKVNDWENAERDREEWLRELRTRTLPDRVLDSYFHIV